MTSAKRIPSRIEKGRGDLGSLLIRIQFVPFALLALFEGKAHRPFLAQLFGLSPSLLRRGKTLNLRESTELRATESANRWIRQRCSEKGWGDEEITARLLAAPSNLAGEPRPYADLIYGLECTGSWGLPLTIAFAAEVDDLINRLVNAHKTSNLDSFKQAFLECEWGGETLGLDATRQDTARHKEALRVSSSWDAALVPTTGFLANILICLLAALDAEFGSTYFCKLQPVPLFLLIAPKMSSKFDLNSLDKIPRRNLVYRPYRRLLELSHALMLWSKEHSWPNKPVGRVELGKILDLGDQSVGNLFDGTRNLSAKLFTTIWDRLCERVAGLEPFPVPFPLLLAAICWQNGLITLYPNQKLKSVTLLDQTNYIRLWNWHRQRWANQLNQGTEGWPAWLGDYSLLSSEAQT